MKVSGFGHLRVEGKKQAALPEHKKAEWKKFYRPAVINCIPSPPQTDPLPEDDLLFLNTGMDSGDLDTLCGMSL